MSGLGVPKEALAVSAEAAAGSVKAARETDPLLTAQIQASSDLTVADAGELAGTVPSAATAARAELPKVTVDAVRAELLAIQQEAAKQGKAIGTLGAELEKRLEDVRSRVTALAVKMSPEERKALAPVLVSIENAHPGAGALDELGQVMSSSVHVPPEKLA